MEGNIKKLIEFANEPYDEERSYDLLAEALGFDHDFKDAELPMLNSGDFASGMVAGRKLDEAEMDRINRSVIEDELPTCLWNDGSIGSMRVEEARKEILRIINSKEDMSFDHLDLSGVSATVMQAGGKIKIQFFLAGWPFTVDDIVFAFFSLLEKTDHSRCDRCGKLFLGTRKGRRRFCSDGCRVASYLRAKRAKARAGGKK